MNDGWLGAGVCFVCGHTRTQESGPASVTVGARAYFSSPTRVVCFLLNWASACGPSSLSFDFIWTWHSLDLFTHSSFGLGLRLNPSGLLMRY
ncbi:hypothetical protein CICLE_v10026850mg [Citrus x clementina]|uniref:Uncharacterized protein n=1 Tax=Citrus clementina TaxID=85681 RepID=V4SRZ2_CITCL|nr:hypothetical protein CICLE_v10026850mg [Citrus x clementina]